MHKLLYAVVSLLVVSSFTGTEARGATGKLNAACGEWGGRKRQRQRQAEEYLAIPIQAFILVLGVRRRVRPVIWCVLWFVVCQILTMFYTKIMS